MTVSEHPAISVAVLHTPWKPERVECLSEMLKSIPTTPTRIIRDKMPEGMAWEEFKTIIALDQWEWSAKQAGCTHHLFLTDDLHMAPDFWRILRAMVTAKPNSIIGLLSNHPKAVELAGNGDVWYRCNSWVVGPAYVVPHELLVGFLAWYKSLPDTNAPGCRRYLNDDSAINEWNTYHGPRESWHPLPTIIEHRDDVASTVGHGDEFSCERVSWRATREVVRVGDAWEWVSKPALFDLEGMAHPPYWSRLAPMLTVGGVF